MVEEIEVLCWVEVVRDERAHVVQHGGGVQ